MIWTQKPPLGSKINFNHPLTKGMTACWLLNEGGSQNWYFRSIKDSVGINNGTVYNRPKWIGNKFLVDGSSNAHNYIFLSAYPTMYSSFTISVWINGTNFDYNIYEEGYHTIFNSGYWKLYMGVTCNKSGNKLSIWFNDSIHFLSSNSLSINKDYHIVFINDIPKNLMRLYINGVQRGTRAASTIVGIATPMGQIGYMESTGHSFCQFCGYIENFLFYNRALSLQEAQTLYTNPYCFINRPIYRKILQEYETQAILIS